MHHNNQKLSFSQLFIDSTEYEVTEFVLSAINVKWYLMLIMYHADIRNSLIMSYWCDQEAEGNY